MKLIYAAALAALLAFPAYAQGRNCAPRDAVIAHLSGQYGETRQSIGINERGAIEMWANIETGTWTATATTPQGITCLIGSGQSFENLSEAKPAPGKDM